MADSKISGLTALASGHAVGDLVELVDISDATMAATGTNKKTTLANLFGNAPAIVAVSYNGLSITTSTGTLAIANGQTLTVSGSATIASTPPVLGANTFIATQTITPAVNTSAIAVSSASLTGASAASFFDYAGTWNTSGTPTAIKVNVTDTASNAASLFLDLQIAGVSKVNFSKTGYGYGTNTQNIPTWSFTGDPDTGLGWRSTNALSLICGGSEVGRITNGLFSFIDQNVRIGAATLGILFNSSNNTSGTDDTGIDRSEAGVTRTTNGAGFVGSHLQKRLVEANTAVAAGANILTQAESYKVLTNEGATAENYHTLPLLSAGSAGLQLTFVVQDADGIRVVANTGDTIRPIAGTAASAAAGFIRCATLGAFITLVAINATEWIAIGSAGTWTIDV